MSSPRSRNPPLKGRGALSNPTGRFESRRHESVDDGWYQEEVPAFVPTSIEPDRARSVIARNESPDIPFEQSINPYRGCSHSCPYCMSGSTPILMGDGTVRPLAKVSVGSVIYGTVRQGSSRRYVRTKVLAQWSVIKPAFRVSLADGTELLAGADHRLLTERGWKFVTGAQTGQSRRPYLVTGNNRLIGTGSFAEQVAKDYDYKRGYLRGMIRGDAHGTLHSLEWKNDAPPVPQPFRLATCAEEALCRAQGYLVDFRLTARDLGYGAAPGRHRAMTGIRALRCASGEQIRLLLEWPSSPSRCWLAGFLAGVFDADGSFTNGILRIGGKDPRIVEWTSRSLREFDLRFATETPGATRAESAQGVRLVGGLREHLRLLHLVDPAVSRKLDIEGTAVKGNARLRVESIVPLGAMRLYDITTGTGDFVANGVISHNCYARPSHAYMGLSPGQDFETRLFYKKDAATLLEAELAKPGYVCKPITLGANTDPYQPIERRMRVTREILEVLTRCRHPVTVITKSALVLRDLDLLCELARDGLAEVGVSITTLDADLKRVMEPQAASPRARLEVLRKLSDAGVPTGVLVAPVIPALTDHEMEAILAGAADAGARWAGYVLLRLPHEVKDLFREWLEAHYPDRAAHVMSLVRQMRGGKDYDARFGARMRGTGPLAQLLRSRFQIACRRLGLETRRNAAPDISLFAPPQHSPADPQLALDL
jgi:DNA repair photolyase